MRLNLASGSDYREGWTNLDITSWDGYPPPDVYWDARCDRIPFDDSCVDEIYCGYTLLHIRPRYRPFFLNEVRRVLRPSGYVAFSEVDMNVVFRRFLEDPSDRSYSELIWGEMGSIHGCKYEEFDTHYFGYCERTLIDEVIKAGFQQPERIRVQSSDVWYELTIRCVKDGQA